MYTINNDKEKSKAIFDCISKDLNLYNNKIFKDKKESYLKKILLSVMAFDIPSAMVLIHKYFTFPKISHKKICIKITETLEEALIIKKITLEATESLLNNFDQQFINEIKKNNEYDDFLDFHYAYSQSKSLNNLWKEKDYYFSNLVTYVNNCLQDQYINDEKLDSLKRFLKYPCILTPRIIELRALARIIIGSYNKEKTSTENDEMLSEEELLSNQERDSFFHLIDKIRSLPNTEEEFNEYLKQYDKKHQCIQKTSNFSNKIEKFSSTASFTYCLSMTVVYITRVYMDFVKDSIQKKLENEHNITNFDNRDWSQYYEHTDDNQLLNALPCILPVILIIFFIINSNAKTILSNHKTNSVLKAIENSSHHSNSKNAFPNLSLYTPLNFCLSFRTTANVILQFIDIITHPIKHLIFDAGVLRWFTFLSLIEETYKFIEFKKKSPNYKLKNEKLVKSSMVALSSLALLSEYLNYSLTADKWNRFLFDLMIKSLKPSVLILFHNLTGGFQDNHRLKEYFYASLWRNMSALIILPSFMLVKNLKYMGLLSTADVLLTVKCDNMVANSIETNNFLKIIEEIYKTTPHQSISHDLKIDTLNNSTKIEIVSSSLELNDLENVTQEKDQHL